jgi:Uncharacterized protein conserved in bacteria (DUF2213)
LSLLDEAGFKENEHPRGQPGNPGQFSSSSGGGGLSKSEGSKSKEQPDFKGSLARQTEADTTQPVKSLDELYERAKKAEVPFKDLLSSLAEKYNSEAKFQVGGEAGTSLKTRSSSERKLKSELNGDVTLLRDVLRGTVVSHDNESARKAAADFIGEHGDDILRVKDRIMDPLKGGYRDILVNYRTPDGLVAEVQFNSKNMVAAKMGGAHALYEKARELINPSVEALEHLEQQMSELYEKAYQADGDGKGWKSEMQAKDSAAEEGKPLRRYKLNQPDGPSFEAVIVKDGNTIKVLSNRDGSWGPESDIGYADLVMPEQKLSDWEVTPLEPGELPKLTQRATDRRQLDTNDIEYYTAESIGPNRERTPEGFLICFDVPVARIGEMIYMPKEVPKELGAGLDGRVRVTRSEAEVFDPRSMASLNGKPVTDDHPPKDVDPKNWKQYLKGVVAKPRRGEDDQSDFVVVDMIIYDQDMIDDIEAGKREVSCGYNPDYLQLLDPETLEPIPGRGEQVNLRYNHLALVQAGRCGPNCAVGDRRTVDEKADDMEVFFTPARARRLRRLLKRFE